MLVPGNSRLNAPTIFGVLIWVLVVFPLYCSYLAIKHYTNAETTAHLLEYMGGSGILPMVIHFANVWKNGGIADDSVSDSP